MPLEPAGEMVREAAGSGRAVLACNAIGIEHAEAIVEGAAAARRPVILALSHNAVRFHGGLEPMAAACRALARGAPGPVGLHLDHVEDEQLVAAAADVGFGSVMFDASTLGDEANVAATAEVTRTAHGLGLWIEAELGEVGGKDGLHAPGARTDPAEAAAYVERTGVDALAVAVGTSHAMTDQTATVDLGLVARLRDALAVPLVLHGSSGLSDRALAAAVGAGMTKINVGTQLNVAWSAAVGRALAEDGGPDPRPALRAARAAMASVVERLLLALDGPLDPAEEAAR